MVITSWQKSLCTGRMPGWNKPPCMTHFPFQKIAIEQALVALLKALQAQSNSSLVLCCSVWSTHRTFLASSHSAVSSMSGVLGVSLIQTSPWRSSVTERTPAQRSARVCAGSTPYLDASENTRDCRFKINTPKPIMPKTVGLIRI
eukprot:Skav212698  [mRNA]  locus=scaffold1930:333586:336210:- [translate_table: standard]